MSAGEPLNPEAIETWKRVTGLTIYEGHGQTESVVMIELSMDATKCAPGRLAGRRRASRSHCSTMKCTR